MFLIEITPQFVGGVWFLGGFCEYITMVGEGFFLVFFLVKTTPPPTGEGCGVFFFFLKGVGGE